MDLLDPLRDGRGQIITNHLVMINLTLTGRQSYFRSLRLRGALTFQKQKGKDCCLRDSKQLECVLVMLLFPPPRSLRILPLRAANLGAILGDKR